jgi:hypothetical protein
MNGGYWLALGMVGLLVLIFAVEAFFPTQDEDRRHR